VSRAKACSQIKDRERCWPEGRLYPAWQERKPNSVLMIRLARRGARKQPYYRIVVIEKERARDGRSVEVVGTYNPRTNPATVDLKRERIHYWTSKGAQLSDRVKKLVEKNPVAVPPASEPAKPEPTAEAPSAV
jgi:small subunit ribosomal protein S16